MAADLGPLRITFRYRIPEPFIWEYFEKGRTFVFPNLIKITRWNMCLFALATGDWNPLHFFPWVARKAGYRGCIAHGGLVMNKLPGALCKLNFWNGTIDALRLTTQKYKLPIYPKDKVHFEMSVLDKQSKEGVDEAGLVKFDFKIKNQRNEEVVTGTLTAIIKKSARYS